MADIGQGEVDFGPQGVAVGNFVHIELKFAKEQARPRTWVVCTAYPE
ncbi:hypothetical protein ACFXCZ_21410 [Streptomyces sp. NPDC059396]